ncbi:hypothetical protein, partial [Streptomyces africanus]|uniref:hypothetical protein n=1 Tax=Streptomyces africanus TaxID=231024 RepID=UPI001ABEEF9B
RAPCLWTDVRVRVSGGEPGECERSEPRGPVFAEYGQTPAQLARSNNRNLPRTGDSLGERTFSEPWATLVE